MDKIPQIAEEQLLMMPKKQSFKDTKVSISVFSADMIDISKSKEISRWWPIDKALDNDFSATKMFFKNCHKSLEYHNMIFPLIALL